jgi:hypothetical protein
MNRPNRVNRIMDQYAYLSYVFVLGREIYAYYSVSHTLKPNRVEISAKETTMERPITQIFQKEVTSG